MAYWRNQVPSDYPQETLKKIFEVGEKAIYREARNNVSQGLQYAIDSVYEAIEDSGTLYELLGEVEMIRAWAPDGMENFNDSIILTEYLIDPLMSGIEDYL